MSTYAPTADPNEVLDFDVEERRSAEPVPKGRWDVIVREVRNATSQAGNPYKQLLFRVIGGDHTANHLNWEQWNDADILCKQPWALALVAEAEGYTTTDAEGKKRVTATVGQLLDYPLVIDLDYKPSSDGKQQWVQIVKVYHPDDAPDDDLGAYADTPMGVENEDRIAEPIPAPAGRPYATTGTGATGGKLSGR